MVKKILTLMALMVLPLCAYAQVDALQMSGNNLSIRNPAATPGAINITQELSFPVQGTQPKYPAAAVITPSTSFPTPPATPNTGDVVANRFNRIVTGAPTATFVELPRATPNVGETFTVINESANPVAIVPQSGDSVNAAAAATPYSCATTKVCDCTGITSAIFSCTSR